MTVLLFLIFLGFAGEQNPVEVHGALREIMFRGDLSSRVKPANLGTLTDLYGLGALTDLKGEILIFGKSIYVARVKNGKVSVTDRMDEGASLLVTTRVKRWQTQTLPEHVRTVQQLEAFLKIAAAEAGLKVDKPFPFLILDKVEMVAWHVIDWPSGDREHTHAKHKAAGANGIIRDRSVKILGFFSTKHKGVFTHHTRDIHMHFATDDHSLIGHVDDLKLLPGSKLSLPVPASD